MIKQTVYKRPRLLKQIVFLFSKQLKKAWVGCQGIFHFFNLKLYFRMLMLRHITELWIIIDK